MSGTERSNVVERLPNGRSFRGDVPQLEDGSFRPLFVRQSARRVEVRAGDGSVLRTVELTLGPNGRNELEL